jgi:hypothetical protein
MAVSSDAGSLAPPAGMCKENPPSPFIFTLTKILL